MVNEWTKKKIKIFSLCVRFKFAQLKLLLGWESGGWNLAATAVAGYEKSAVVAINMIIIIISYLRLL